MKHGNLQARIHYGSRVEVVANDNRIHHLIALISSILEEERAGISAEIVDIDCDQVLYRCCRSAY